MCFEHIIIDHLEIIADNFGVEWSNKPWRWSGFIPDSMAYLDNALLKVWMLILLQSHFVKRFISKYDPPQNQKNHSSILIIECGINISIRHLDNLLSSQYSTFSCRPTYSNCSFWFVKSWSSFQSNLKNAETGWDLSLHSCMRITTHQKDRYCIISRIFKEASDFEHSISLFNFRKVLTHFLQHRLNTHDDLNR